MRASWAPTPSSGCDTTRPKSRLASLKCSATARPCLWSDNRKWEVLLVIMSGHSKWAKVKHFKGAIDAKRGKIFSKLSKEISIATKLGGADPGMNPRLRMVLLKCRGANMPNDNIDRAIKKGTGGGETANFEDLTYEIYGPHGVALLVDVSTDNRNRPASEIRSVLTKNGGAIASAGSG